jgi:hypothetical protein
MALEADCSGVDGVTWGWYRRCAVCGRTRQGCDKTAWMVERAIVLQVLREDHEERWCRTELGREITDFDRVALDEALLRLADDGVLHCSGEVVCASRAARRLDELEMIGI